MKEYTFIIVPDPLTKIVTRELINTNHVPDTVPPFIGQTIYSLIRSPFRAERKVSRF